jgi:hypothetical protein
MPIRINFLAEAQALEELRRRDPVKRAIYASALLLLLVLAWVSSLQLKVIVARGALSQIQGKIAARSTEYQRVLASQKVLGEVNHNLAALEQLSTNRFLNGSFLNSLQASTLDDVQLVRVRADQSYLISDAVKPKTNDNNIIIPGKPAIHTEKILLTMDATDTSASPGDRINRFRETISGNPDLRQALAPTNGISLKSLSAPQISPMTGKPCVLFTLECRYKDRIR